MAGEQDMSKTGTVAAVANSLAIMNLSDKDLTSGNNEIPSDSSFSIASSGDATSSIKGVNNKSVREHGVSYPPSCYNNYYYPGYSSNIKHTEGYYQSDGSYTGIQSHDDSLVYNVPGYNPYADDHSLVQKPCFSSPGYIQQPYGMNSMKSNGNMSSRFSKPVPQSHPLRPLNKVSRPVSNFSSSYYRGGQPSYHYQKQYFPQIGSLNHSQSHQKQYFPQNVSLNYSQNQKSWSGNDRFNQRDKYTTSVDSGEITRGPRSQNSSTQSDSPVANNLELTARRDQYNLPDFETRYENAKFYVIKSFSEDNVHKCIKYDVWSSTANGNRKLDAAFLEAEARANETGTKCPVFLFFSVNGSGQFVGCAEMVGKVDFNKDMDFWQLDKWNGFFPVKWHIVKDIPNSQLRHIVLENSEENRDVTYTRDTQEIVLKQGLEMLKIFKNYSAKTSLLDDFNFYEVREKSGRAKKITKPATQQNRIHNDADFPKHINVGEMKGEADLPQTKRSLDVASLVNLTKNLSIDA